MLNAVIIGLGLTGMVLILTGSDVIPQNLQRGLLASTCFMVFTHSRPLRMQLRSLLYAVRWCWPFIATMLVGMAMFGRLCQDVFSYPEVDHMGYFKDFKSILLTTFQIFTGNGWNSIMWDLFFQTNLVTTLLFCVYFFLNVLLVGQLVLGVIISVFSEITSSPSMRIYSALEPFLQNIPAKERETLMEDFLLINFRLYWIHEKIDDLDRNRQRKWWKEEADLLSSTELSSSSRLAWARTPSSMPSYIDRPSPMGGMKAGDGTFGDCVLVRPDNELFSF